MTGQPTILITGASRGLGRALAKHFTAQGAIVFGCSRNASDFAHDHYTHIAADITQEAEIKALFVELAQKAERLDVLINCAGVKHDALTLLSSLSQAEDMMRTNFLGTYLATKAAVRMMMRNHFGRIINISSIAVPLGSAGSGIYAASKAAVEQFSHSLARECAGDDITVNTVGVTVFEESGMADEVNPVALQKALNGLIKPTALDIEEIAHAVAFFMSPLAAMITNQVVYFGGTR